MSSLGGDRAALTLYDQSDPRRYVVAVLHEITRTDRTVLQRVLDWATKKFSDLL